MSTDASDVPTVSDHDYRVISEYLFREALLLDRGQFKEWLALLTQDVTYRLLAPMLSMSRAGVTDTAGEVVLMDETYGSLKTRVQQLSTPIYTVAENPRSFTRRFVTNIVIDAITDDGQIEVHTNVLVYRSRGTQMEPHVFSMSREDALRRVDGKLYLARRVALLDESVVGARNIAALL